MDRRGALMYALAFLFFPSVIAAMSWGSGIAQMVGVFIVMVLLDAPILAIAHLVQARQD